MFLKSEFSTGITSLNFRQACVFELLAHHNPNMTVYLLMTGHHLDLNSSPLGTLDVTTPMWKKPKSIVYLTLFGLTGNQSSSKIIIVYLDETAQAHFDC